MKVVEVKKIVLESLIPISEEFGYKINSGKFALVNKSKEMQVKLQFTENHWYNEVQIIPRICIDVFPINNIWKEFDNYIYDTCDINLRHLQQWYNTGAIDDFGYGTNMYKLFNYDKDIDTASKDIQILFKEYGLRYIKEYGSVAGIDKLYNANPELDYPLNRTNFQIRCIVGLIAAKLSNNPNYKNICDIYTERVNIHKQNKTLNLSDIDIFFKVKECLNGL